MNIEVLTQQKILCLQYAGMTSSQIMHQKYNDLEFTEAFELYIDKAKNIITIQQERGVETITFQDETFPQSLRKIGVDCPAMIHCLGDLSLLNPNKKITIIGAHAISEQPFGVKVNPTRLVARNRLQAAMWQYAHHAFCPKILQTLSRGCISGI